VKPSEKEERELMERRFHIITNSSMAWSHGDRWVRDSLSYVANSLRYRRNITRLYKMLIDLDQSEGLHANAAIEAIADNPACPPKLAALLALQRGVEK
jgi:hypothetical protein